MKSAIPHTCMMEATFCSFTARIAASLLSDDSWEKVSQKFCKMFYPGLESTRSVRSLNKILQKKIYENQTKF